MNNIVPITKARGRLGDLASLAVASNYYVLTRGGNPAVALVDFDYLKKLEEIVKQITQKTFIDPKLDKFTREFSDKEIAEWQSEDQF
jgi:hypothetical protein